MRHADFATLGRERNCKVAKKRVNRYPKAFRLMALEQMKSCDNVSELARELNVDRSVLYHWRDQLAGEGDGTTIKSPVRELRREIRTHFNYLSTRWQELKRLWRRWKKRRKPQSHQNCSKKSPQNQDFGELTVVLILP